MWVWFKPTGTETRRILWLYRYSLRFNRRALSRAGFCTNSGVCETSDEIECDELNSRYYAAHYRSTRCHRSASASLKSIIFWHLQCTSRINPRPTFLRTSVAVRACGWALLRVHTVAHVEDINQPPCLPSTRSLEEDEICSAYHHSLAASANGATLPGDARFYSYRLEMSVCCWACCNSAGKRCPLKNPRETRCSSYAALYLDCVPVSVDAAAAQLRCWSLHPRAHLPHSVFFCRQASNSSSLRRC